MSENVYGKNYFVRHAYKHTNASLGQSHDVINDFLKTVGVVLGNGNQVRLVPFGKFTVTHYKSRKGRNPQTGKALKLSAHNTPSFHAGRGLKKAVNK